MEINKDLIAASSTPIVLAILAESDSYGYAILKRVRELSGGRMEWTDGLLPSKFEPLILLTEPDATKMVVVEGHSRLTGYVISGDRLPDLTDCYLGISPEASTWGCF